MTKRPWLLALMFLGGSLFFAPPAEAQRSGFIIGFGLGPGLASYTGSSPEPFSSDRENHWGVATDFHIGGVIGDSFELYFMSKMIFINDMGTGIVATGVNGVGFTYPLNPDFYINGGLGVGLWAEIEPFDLQLFSNSAPPEFYTGFGLVAGGGYRLSERWVLDFDIMYARPGDDSKDISMLGAQLTINVLSLSNR